VEWGGLGGARVCETGYTSHASTTSDVLNLHCVTCVQVWFTITRQSPLASSGGGDAHMHMLSPLVHYRQILAVPPLCLSSWEQRETKCHSRHQRNSHKCIACSAIQNRLRGTRSLTLFLVVTVDKRLAPRPRLACAECGWVVGWSGEVGAQIVCECVSPAVQHAHGRETTW
jgi:hypothetical protein